LGWLKILVKRAAEQIKRAKKRRRREAIDYRIARIHNRMSRVVCGAEQWSVPMHFKLLEQRPKTYILTFKTGDELAAGLKQFAADEKLAGSSFKAIGAFSSVRLGWFDWGTKEYRASVVFDEQVELVSLIGDIALSEGKPPGACACGGGEIRWQCAWGAPDGGTCAAHV
jgi:Plants and Prokaryotes Conserved (PCC) domain